MSKKKSLVKYMTEKEFGLIQKREWQIVELIDDTLPNWMKSIPMDNRGCHIYASGSGIKKVNQREVVGGIDVFRDARNESEPVDWNKDHYVVLKTSEDDKVLLIVGPLKDNEHWINEIPEHFKNVEILTFNRDAKMKN